LSKLYKLNLSQVSSQPGTKWMTSTKAAS